MAQANSGQADLRGGGWLLAATPLVVLLAHYVAVLPHEFSHSFMAWVLGLKADPLAIDWGGDSLLNVLLLVHIDENVDYDAAFAAGEGWKVALVAFAGPGLANGGMYAAFRALLGRARSPAAAFLLLWLVLMNLANLYDYVPLRTFADNSDVEHFLRGTGLSPWWVYVVGGYGVLAATVDFFARALPLGLDRSGVQAAPSRAAMLVAVSAILFGYFAIPALLETDPVSRFMGGTSLALVPVVVFAAWKGVMRRPAEPAA